jgi:hypothetical protein
MLRSRRNAAALMEKSIKNMLGLVTIGLSLLASAEQTGVDLRQARMALCNREAGGDKKGDERKTFMKTCLSANRENPEQAKLRTCVDEAMSMKGDAREKLISECLKEE